jgi:hypothetical protein
MYNLVKAADHLYTEHGLILLTSELNDIWHAFTHFETNGNKVYICGKVTGLPFAEVAKKFNNAEADLEGKGYDVVNPIKLVNDANAPWPTAMRICIAGLIGCQYIHLLPDYLKSPGATLEYQIALKLGIIII